MIVVNEVIASKSEWVGRLPAQDVPAYDSNKTYDICRLVQRSLPYCVNLEFVHFVVWNSVYRNDFTSEYVSRLLQF